MAVLRLARFTIDPANAEEMLAKRAALVAAIRDAFPGLIAAPLAKHSPLTKGVTMEYA